MKKNVTVLLCSLSCLLTAPPAALAANAQNVVTTVTAFLTERTHNIPGNVSVTVKAPDERQLALASCMQLQAFLPQGQQAWGRVTVGVRCISGPNASLYVSAIVKVDGSYVKLTRPVSGGQTIGEGDVQLEQGELTAHPSDLVLSLKDAVGQTPRQALSPGQPLRNTYLQHEGGIRAGQLVKIVANGNGFSVVNHGHALNGAMHGELIRVKLDDGQVLSGIAGDAGVVDVSSTR